MKAYYTNDELKKLLRVSEEALQRFRRDPEDPLPHLRAGRRYLYIPEEVENWARARAEREKRTPPSTPADRTVPHENR